MATNRNLYQLRMLKYKKKSKRIKKLMKNMIFENAALRDQVAQIQDTIYSVKEERRFLLKKLMEFDSEIAAMEVKPSPPLTALLPVNATGISNGTLLPPPPPPPPPPQKSRNRISTESLNRSSNKNFNNTIVPNSVGPDEDDESLDAAQHQSIVQTTISVDHLGRPIYPVHIENELSVYDLGEIVSDRPGYHNENYIYPIGFVSTRIYGHMKEPERKCTYTCKITDGGDFPRFEIIPEMDMDYAIAGPSPDLCHAVLLQTINCHSDGRHIEVRPQGECFFGLGHPTVMTLLQTLTNAAECAQFGGFKTDSIDMDLQNDPTVNYDALQIYLGTSAYHMVPEIKEEPPEELLEQYEGSSFNALP